MPKLTLEAIEKRIAALQQAAEDLKRNDKAPIIGQIVALMEKHDVTLPMLRKALQSPGLDASGGPTKARNAVAAKYRDPASGKTWSGRGKTPRWLADAEQAGTARDSFLIR